VLNSNDFRGTKGRKLQAYSLALISSLTSPSENLEASLTELDELSQQFILRYLKQHYLHKPSSTFEEQKS
jgi:hypothetical protein